MGSLAFVLAIEEDELVAGVGPVDERVELRSKDGSGRAVAMKTEDSHRCGCSIVTTSVPSGAADTARGGGGIILGVEVALNGEG